jgi:hypothetical protein
MAVALAFRVAIVLAGVGVRIVKWAEGPGVDTPARLSEELWRRLADPAESESDLEAAVTAETGTLSDVPTFTGTFEMRRLQVKFEVLVGGAVVDDARINTYDFLKLVGGSPSDSWVAADFTAVESAFGQCWSTIKPYYNANLRHAQYRWYKSGPGIAPPQEPVRVVDVAVVGSSVSTAQLPPQCALACTELTSSRKAWGRVYWPAMAHAVVGGTPPTDGTGRYKSEVLTAFANSLDTYYEACRAAGAFPVVYSPAKPSRPSAGGTLAATGARALTIDTIQVDDVPDVIRSRRHKATTLKVQRGLT